MMRRSGPFVRYMAQHERRVAIVKGTARPLC